MSEHNSLNLGGNATAMGCSADWVSLWWDGDAPGRNALEDTAIASIATVGVCETPPAAMTLATIELIADEWNDGGPGYAAAAWDGSPPLMVDEEEEEEEFEDEDDDFDDEEDEDFDDDFDDEDDDFDDDEEFEGDDEE